MLNYRIVHNQIPTKIEYELSEYGESLQGILDSLCTWEKNTLLEYMVINPLY